MDRAQHVPVIAGRVTACSRPLWRRGRRARRRQPGPGRSRPRAARGVPGHGADRRRRRCGRDRGGPRAARALRRPGHPGARPVRRDPGHRGRAADRDDRAGPRMGLLFDLGRVLTTARRAGTRLRLRPGRPAGHADGPDRRAVRRRRRNGTRRRTRPHPARYGKERFARRIADAVVHGGAFAPITSSPTAERASGAPVPNSCRRTRRDPASATLQALRSR